MEAAYETLGSHQSQVVVKLKRNGGFDTKHFVQTLKDAINNMKLISTKVDYIMEESIFTAGAEVAAPIVVKLHGTDLKKLNELAGIVARQITPIKGLYGIKTTIASPSPETRIVVNKDKASLYNINVRDIAQTSLIAIKGLVATKFKEEGNEYDINVSLDPQYKKDITNLKGIQIYSSQGFAVPLNEVATLTRGKGPSEVKRYDQQRVIFVSANLFGESLQKASEMVTQTITEIDRPEGYTIDLIGETEEAKESFKNLLFIIILAFTLVYMIMASQFESTWQPFIIMFTVPFSIIGVSLILSITGTSLNGMVMVGILLLGGVVVNNAIVLIEYLNQRLAEGKPLMLSAIEASKIRLRPIIMTALTTVLGFTPMAFSRSEGAELLSPLAITVIGGLIFATVLTLWVIPVLYVIVAGVVGKVRKQ